MRIALLPALLLVASQSACATYSSSFWIGGTADYAATSAADRAKDEAGAAPVRALYCQREPVRVGGTLWRSPPPLLRLADGCVLEGNRTGDTCDLPTERGPLRVVVKSVSVGYTLFAHVSRYGPHYSTGLPMDVVVGGETAEGGRYVTYRFTGSALMRDATSEECDAVAGALPSGELPRASKPGDGAPAEVDWSSWKSGTLCTAQGCAD